MGVVYKWFVEDELGLSSLTCTLNQVNKALKKESFDDLIIEGFNLYTLVNSLGDGKKKQWQPKENPESLEAVL